MQYLYTEGGTTGFQVLSEIIQKCKNTQEPSVPEAITVITSRATQVKDILCVKVRA